jgi:hypothetical protein
VQFGARAGDGDDAKAAGAGVKDNADNLGAVSKIAKVIIKGNPIGTLARGDDQLFGIEAQEIGSIKLAGGKVPLIAGASNDLFATNRHPLGVTFSTFDANGFDFHAFEV